MFYDSLSFNAMKSSLDALAIEQKVILQNLANYETPGYKSKNVSFENVLREASKKDGSGKYDFKAKIYAENNTVVRPDGNNVDSDAESLKLYQNYVQTMYLYQKISGKFTNMDYILEQSAK